MIPSSPALLLRPQPKLVTGAAFTPASAANLWLWLSADFGTCTDSACTTTTTTDATKIQGWKDQSGSARNFSQTDINQSPILKNTIINGKPVLRFDGTTFSNIGQDLEGTASAAGLTAGEIFIIVAASADPAVSIDRSGLWSFGGADDTLYPYTDGNIYDIFGSTARTTVGNPTPSLASFNLYNVVSTSSEWTAFLNGSLLSTSGTNTVSFPSVPKIARSNSAHGFSGDIAEIVMLSAKASAGDKTNLKSYFATKYGLIIV